MIRENQLITGGSGTGTSNGSVGICLLNSSNAIVTNNCSIQGGGGTATESSGGGSVGINCYAQPLITQLEHFCRVVGGEEKPLVDDRDGARSLAVALAVLESTRRQGLVELPAS